jgi:phosphatidylserine/phosphatidylglycerophosphate/cardiolipin synthase-like enzyme
MRSILAALAVILGGLVTVTLTLAVAALPATAAPAHAATACPTFRHKPAPTRTTFSRPGHGQVLADQMTQVVCSARRGSTIRVAMYGIESTGSAREVINALRWQSRHGVKVKIIVEGAAGYDYRGTRWSRKAFGRSGLPTITCVYTCRTSNPGSSMHSKFIVAEKTQWGGSLALITSANLSESQLDKRWESAVTVYGDRPLALVLARRFDAMVRCNRVKTCTRYPGETGWQRTQTGQLLLSPTAGDPIASFLNTIACRKGSKVAINMLFVHKGRDRSVAAIRRLKTRGCAASIVVRPGPQARESGLGGVECVWSHDKSIVVDAWRHGRRYRAVLAGSQNLSETGASRNDDVLFLTTELTAWRMYTAQAKRMRTSASPSQCGKQTRPPTVRIPANPYLPRGNA